MSLRQPATLDELLNFRLQRLHALSGAPVIRLLEGQYGIARREWALLALLAARGPLSPSALADEAQLDRPRTSRALGPLVAKGLVQRQAEPGDQRRAQVMLTGAGQRLVAEIFPQVARINQSVLAVLDDSSLATLDQALAALTAQARRVNAEQVQDWRADRQAGAARHDQLTRP